MLPLFLFAAFCLMMPMKMIDRHRQVQAALERVGEELSQYGAFLGTEEKEEEKPGKGLGSAIGQMFGEGYVRLRVLGSLDTEGLENISFVRSRIMEEDMIHLVMDYRIRLPFSVFGLESIPMENVCSRRAWTGRAQGKTLEDPGNQEGEEDVLVYVGKNPTRYHLSPQCHYLNNDLQQVDMSYVDGLRNSSGQRYRPCRRCVSEGQKGTVYIMPSGERYHQDRNCSAIVAYVRAVKKSQVEYLGACSYCGGG